MKRCGCAEHYRPARGAGRLLAFAIGFVVMLAACAPPAAQPKAVTAPASSHSAEVQRLLAAAKAAGEGEIILSWSEDNLAGADGARRFGEVFNRMYGTNIRVTFTQGPNATGSAQKIVQESAAGQTAFTDLVRYNGSA